MKFRTVLLAASAFALVFGVGAADAATVTVTAADGSQGWFSPAGENTGGGTASITSVSQDGNGALAVTGDRTRLAYGDMFGTAASPSLGTVSQFSDLSFSYMVDAASVSGLDPKYSPALRLVFINSAGDRDELVYETAYQPGGYGSAPDNGLWNTTDSSSAFYLKSNGDENNNRSITDWAASLGNDQVVGFYIGVGSTAGSGYLAHVDDVIANGTKYDFALNGSGGVPEPATWALMLLGFGSAGAMLRRRKLAAA